MKIIIYCRGAIFRKYSDKLPWNLIVAIVDKNAEDNEMIMSIPVIRPEYINKVQYDCICVLSNKYFYEIVKELIYVYSVSAEKIVSWKVLLKKCLPINQKILKDIINGLQNKSVLIREKEIFDKYILNKESIGIPSESLFEAYSKNKESDNSYKYDYVYSEDEIPNNKKYDIVITGDYKNLASVLKVKTWHKVLLNTKYNMDNEMYSAIVNDIGKLHYRVYIGSNGWIWEIDNIATKIPSDEKKEMSVYVVTHKDYPQIKNDDCYIPLCVGEKYKNSKYVSELNGKNIAYLNDKINECTGLYWIWKNTKENIVGLNHYRRYFSRGIINNRADILLSYEIYQMMNKYDMVLPVDEGFDITVKQQLVNTIPDKKIAELGISIMRNSIMQKQPDYLAFFDDVMNSYNFYRCNMFITRREILNQYCEWLFSFLIDAAEQIDVSETDEYSKRIIGFLAERMLTVWLRKNPQKIKAVPYLLL